MKRGDIVIAVTPGIMVNSGPSLSCNPISLIPHMQVLRFAPSSPTWLDAPLFRLSLQPTAENGLEAPSQIMVDKITTVRKEKLRQAIGRLIQPK